MHIYGLDFTSAPGLRKPITVVSCNLNQRSLQVEACQELTSFAAFEAFLRTPGPWLAAFDFPFGLPRKLLTNLGWPVEWSAYIQHIADLGKTGFEQALTTYRQSRPAGDKHHLRATDKLAGARSPMMLHRVPVAKMFFQGTTRLLHSAVSVLPMRPTDDTRIVLEGYPALVARACIGRLSYKSDERARQISEQFLARQQLLAALCSPVLLTEYGLHLDLPPTGLRQKLLADPMGDYLDALLCAIQAAWAATQPGYGVPKDCDAAEGWIIDVQLC